MNTKKVDAARRAAQRAQMRDEFYAALGEFLGGTNQAAMSLALQAQYMPSSAVKAVAALWMRMRQATPLSGYPTAEEAAREVREFLTVGRPR